MNKLRNQDGELSHLATLHTLESEHNHYYCRTCKELFMSEQTLSLYRKAKVIVATYTVGNDLVRSN